MSYITDRHPEPDAAYLADAIEAAEWYARNRDRLDKKQLDEEYGRKIGKAHRAWLDRMAEEA